MKCTSHHPGLLPATIRFVILLLAGLGGCRREFPPMGVQEQAVVPYAIAAVEQNGNGNTALITIKIPNNVDESFGFTVETTDGKAVAVTAGDDNVVGKFNLRTYTTAALTAGQTYSAHLIYQNAQKQPISVVRRFVAERTNAWKKLPDAPIASGDFTGAALLSPLFNRQLAVYRYESATKWNILKFNGKWESSESEIPVPRHNAIAFPLGQLGGRELIFMGFGYIDNDKIPSKKAYMNDFWWTASYFQIGVQAGSVFPQFENIDSDVKFFITYDNAYLLKEDGPGSMESMDITWDRKPRSPLPEKTGKLVAFTIDSTGYVINQAAGQKAHLYAYSIPDDKWTRKADFPGPDRTEGAGFSAKGKGYFGFGVDNAGNGLRDVWEYDPTQNQWKYHSQYPGQGNRLLIAISDTGKAYAGWGYEVAEVPGSAAKLQTGCTDFWEFNP